MFAKTLCMKDSCHIKHVNGSRRGCVFTGVSTMTPENAFILESKGQRSRSRVTNTIAGVD